MRILRYCYEKLRKRSCILQNLHLRHVRRIRRRFSQFDADKLSQEDKAFADALIRGVIEQKDKLDGIITQFCRAYRAERIYRPDLACLELALYEMINCDTPHPVVINEAAGIAKNIPPKRA